MNQTVNSYYSQVSNRRKYDFIIGHVPYLVDGCFTMKDNYVASGHKPKVLLVVHSLPRSEDQVDSDMLDGWLQEADVVFSVGKAVHSELQPYVDGLDGNQKPVHKLYIPGYPVEFFGVTRETRGNRVQGTQYVSMMTEDQKNLDIPGLDFPLAVSASEKASQHIHTTDGERVKLELLGVKEEDRSGWRSWFREIQKSGLTFECPPAENFDKIKKRQLKRSNLFIQPLEVDSILFGVEALTAGVPILVSQNSGIASLLENLIQHEMIVRSKSNEL